MRPRCCWEARRRRGWMLWTCMLLRAHCLTMLRQSTAAQLAGLLSRRRRRRGWPRTARRGRRSRCCSSANTLACVCSNGRASPGPCRCMLGSRPRPRAASDVPVAAALLWGKRCSVCWCTWLGECLRVAARRTPPPHACCKGRHGGTLRVRLRVGLVPCRQGRSRMRAAARAPSMPPRAAHSTRLASACKPPPPSTRLLRLCGDHARRRRRLRRRARALQLRQAMQPARRRPGSARCSGRRLRRQRSRTAAARRHRTRC